MPATWSSFGPISLVLLLLIEVETIMVSNYELRTELRTLVPLPLYHCFLVFLASAAIYISLGKRRGLLVKPRYRWRAAAFHLAVFSFIYQSCQNLHASTHHWPRLGFLLFWLSLASVLIVSWMGIWFDLVTWRRILIASRGPIVFCSALSICVPIFANLTSETWFTFSQLTFAMTQQGLDLIYSDTFASPEDLKLGTPSFIVEILPGCSGYEGIGLVTGLVCLYLWIKSDELEFPRALILIPAGILASWFANILRLICLIYIGSEFSPQVAMIGFHSQAGWLSFTCISLFLIYWAESSGCYARQSNTRSKSINNYPALPYLAPFLALLLGGILSNAVSTGFNVLYSIKPMLAALTLALYIDNYRKIFSRPSMPFSSISLGIFVYIVWIFTESRGLGVSPQDVLDPTWACLWTIGRCLGAIVIVPLVEELAFRGYLLRRLQQVQFEHVTESSPSLLAILVSSLAFGLLHSNWLGGTIAGIAFALLARRGSGLSESVLAHATANFCIALQVLVGQDWWLWN